MIHDVRALDRPAGAPAVLPRGIAGAVVGDLALEPVFWSWEWAIERFDFAFQPIVNVHNGVCFGFEALLRNWDEVGFVSIEAVFDAAAEDMILYQVESALRAKAIRKFATIRGCEAMKLFYNLDNRCLDFGVGQSHDTARALERANLPPGVLFLEVSERHDLGPAAELAKVLGAYRERGHKLVLDDYGVGFSQLKMLYHCEPDIIKIDRFFVSDINADKRKEMLVAQAVNMAHLMGAMVVAEGVETEAEYYTCKRVGCDLVQGYLVQRPDRAVENLLNRYPVVEALNSRDRRSKGDDVALVNCRMSRMTPIRIRTDVCDVLRYFHDNHAAGVVPVVDEWEQPLGVVREADFKEFSYSLYGRELLKNPVVRPRLEKFVKRCPTVDISERVERILEVFASAESQDGVIVTEDMRYVGFLDGLALLELLNEKNTVAARDQNPLTQLPGNNAIYRYASEMLARDEADCFFVYFDFDNFKPFNDTFGFRQGDRAILLFAEILQKTLLGGAWFVGHIGGDDFFVGARRNEYADLVRMVAGLIDDFGQQISSFYDADSRARGCIEGVDRQGNRRCFPLMTVSAAILQLPPTGTTISIDDVAPLIFELKKAAKASEMHCVAAALTSACSMPR